MSTPDHPVPGVPGVPGEPESDAAAHFPGEPADGASAEGAAPASDLPPQADVQATIASGGSSSLADGEWHRLHPLTPLLKGGIVLLIVAGIIISNMRDRIVTWFIDNVLPESGYEEYTGEGDPIDWLIDNNLLLWGSLGAVGLIVVLCAIFYVFWRFHTFRITQEHVEVRKGILFRSHRRAPLDRVQGVNLTRPFPARLIGMAKLEVVGAGADANVALEYLSTSLSEQVRADILRLASGARLAKRIARGEVSSDATAAQRLTGAVTKGVTGLIEGVDQKDVAPESVVKIPAGRLVGSQLLTILPWFVIAVAFGIVMMIMPLIFGDGPGAVFGSVGAALGIGIPLVIAFTAVTWGLISRSLRYSIAPTSDGVRTTYGLLTTVTETLPPGRVHALEITQPLLWRPFGWWSVRINRMTGASATQQASSSQQQFNTALPVGLADDVVRVVRLMLPDLPAEDLPLVYEHGLQGPLEGDPYRVMRRGVGWRRPVSWRRHGYVLTDYGLLLRRGRIWRKVAVFPLARLQGLSIAQGPIDRMQRVGAAQAHVITGPISGVVTGIDREPLLALVDDVSRRAALAAGRDVSHRWAEVLEETRAEQAAAATVTASVPELVEGPDTPRDPGRFDRLSDRAEGEPDAPGDPGRFDRPSGRPDDDGTTSA